MIGTIVPHLRQENAYDSRVVTYIAHCNNTYTATHTNLRTPYSYVDETTVMMVQTKACLFLIIYKRLFD